MARSSASTSRSSSTTRSSASSTTSTLHCVPATASRSSLSSWAGRSAPPLPLRSMASYQIIAWKDVPAMVEARDATDTVTRQLSDRFQQLIDSVAMRLGLQDQDAYLDLWARSDPQERSGSAAEVAEAVAAELEARFSDFIAQAFNRP